MDKIVSSGGKTLRWNTHTSARIEFGAAQAILHLNGKRLSATIASPKGTQFEIISANAPRPQGQQPDVSNLVVD